MVQPDLIRLLFLLYPVNMSKASPQLHQFPESPSLRDDAVFHIKDFVAVHHRGESVRRDNQSLLRKVLINIFQHHMLCIHIQGGCGIVQHKDRRIFQKGSQNLPITFLSPRKAQCPPEHPLLFE